MPEPSGAGATSAQARATVSDTRSKPERETPGGQRQVVHRDRRGEGQQHRDSPQYPYRIQDKLGIGTKQELMIWVVRNGLVDDIVVGVDSQPEPEGQ